MNIDPITGFRLRPAQWNALEAVTQLIYASCKADGNASMAISADELLQEWKTPDFNLETDAPAPPVSTNAPACKLPASLWSLKKNIAPALNRKSKMYLEFQT